MTYRIVEEPRRVYAVTPSNEVIAGAFLPAGEDSRQVGRSDWIVYLGPHVGRVKYHAHCATRTAATWWVREYASRYVETALEETA